jgi:hypothetical protein
MLLGSFFSKVIREYSVESEHDPNGADAQYGMGEVPAGGQKYTKPKYTWSVLLAMGAKSAALCVYGAGWYCAQFAKYAPIKPPVLGAGAGPGVGAGEGPDPGVQHPEEASHAD